MRLIEKVWFENHAAKWWLVPLLLPLTGLFWLLSSLRTWLFQCGIKSSIKVSILTRSLTQVTNSVALRRYVLLDAQPYTITDAVNRQVFNSSFVINNY